MNRFDPRLLAVRPEWAFAVERDVRFQDVDAAGIVFFPRLLEYCNDVLVAWFAEVGLPLAQALAEGEWGAPVRSCHGEFLKPLRFGDRTEVALVRAATDDTEIALGFRIARLRDGVVAAVAETRHVVLEPRSFTRRPVPEALRKALEPFTAR